MVRDTLQEEMRRQNFVRIYPSKSSNIYDKYFPPTRQLHKVVHRILFSDEYFTLSSTSSSGSPTNEGRPKDELPSSFAAGGLSLNGNKLEPLRPSQTSTLSNPEDSQKQPGTLPALPSNRVLVGGPASRNPKVKQVGTNQPSQKDQSSELPLGNARGSPT